MTSSPSESLQQARERSEASGRYRSKTCDTCKHRTFAGWCTMEKSTRYNALVAVNKDACEDHHERN